MFLKDKGIVLKIKKLKEADKIVTVFAYENGKLNIVFKGVDKPTSKKLSATQLGCYINFNCYQKNSESLPYAKEVEIINYFPKIRESKIKILYLNYFIELFFEFTQFHQPDKKLFELLLEYLNEFENLNETKVENFMRFIEFFLINYSGIMPNLKECYNCKSKIENSGYFYLNENYILCDKCMREDFDNIFLDKNVYDALYMLENKNYKNFSFEVNDVLKILFKSIIKNYLSKEIKSEKIITKIFSEINKNF